MPGFGIVAAVLGIVITMTAIDGPVEEIGEKVGAALVGTFLGILLSYGFLAPLSVRMEFLGAAELAFFRTIATLIEGFANDLPPKVALEYGRRGVGSEFRLNRERPGQPVRRGRCVVGGLIAMAGHGGGAWKVAYADFVTAMMAFFLVMWITAQNKAVKVAVARYFNDPFNSKSKTHRAQPAGSTTTGPLEPGSVYLMPTRTPGNAPGVVKRHTTPRPAPLKNADHTAKAASGGRKDYDGEKPMVFLLHNSDNHAGGVVILFSDTAGELSPEAMRQLKGVIPALLGKRNKIEKSAGTPRGPLRGLAAPRPTPGSSSYTRCLATMAFLEREGVEPERIRLSQAGPFEPHRARDDPEDLSHNSFVDVYMLGEFVDDFMHPREEKVTGAAGKVERGKGKDAG